MSDRVRQAFDRWIAHQDQASLESLGTVRAWMGTTFLVLFIVALGAWIPGSREFLELDPQAALLAYLLPLAGGLGLAFIGSKDRVSPRLTWLSVLMTSAALKFFCVMLIVHSSTQGALLFVSMLLFTAGAHGRMHRVTVSEPFMAIGTLLACLIGVALAPSSDHRITLVVSMGLAVVGELLLGTWARHEDEARQAREQMEAAILAQELEQSTAQVQQLSDSLVEVLGRAHDARNALSVVDMGVDALAHEVSTMEAAEDRRSVQRIERILRSGADRVRCLVEHGLQPIHVGIEDLQAAASVELQPVLDTLHRGTRSTRAIPIEVQSDLETPLRVRVRGGRETLVRILDNLITNAEQGDGQRMASKVWIRISMESNASTVRIDVEDDGPGFGAEQLTQPVTAFSSSKHGGTGLGLYTVERLVRASGGTLLRANRASGGAHICVRLPCGERV